MKPSWQTSKLGDLLAVLRNEVNCKQDKGGNGDKISRIESIADASFNLEKVGYTTLSAGEKERYRLEIGDILFSHINSVAHVGKTAVFHCPEPVYHGVNLLLMRPKDVVTSAYLEHSLKYLYQSGYWSKVCKQSVNQASVNQQDISKVGITYPRSITEQERIVGILDEAFEGIATAKANAKRTSKTPAPSLTAISNACLRSGELRGSSKLCKRSQRTLVAASRDIGHGTQSISMAGSILSCKLGTFGTQSMW